MYLNNFVQSAKESILSWKCISLFMCTAESYTWI